MKKLFPAFILSMSIVGAALAAPPTADQVLESAKATARATHKNVFVIFHASWCIWCHRMDDLILHDRKAESIFKKNYVFAQLDVQERGDKTVLENAGGAEWMKKLGGENAGLPFFAIISPSGKILADSMEEVKGKRENMGCPVDENDQKNFMQILTRTAPKMSGADLAAVQEVLKGVKSKISAKVSTNVSPVGVPPSRVHRLSIALLDGI